MKSYEGVLLSIRSQCHPRKRERTLYYFSRNILMLLIRTQNRFEDARWSIIDYFSLEFNVLLIITLFIKKKRITLEWRGDHLLSIKSQLRCMKHIGVHLFESVAFVELRFGLLPRMQDDLRVKRMQLASRENPYIQTSSGDDDVPRRRPSRNRLPRSRLIFARNAEASTSGCESGLNRFHKEHSRRLATNGGRRALRNSRLSKVVAPSASYCRRAKRCQCVSVNGGESSGPRVDCDSTGRLFR